MLTITVFAQNALKRTRLRNQGMGLAQEMRRSKQQRRERPSTMPLGTKGTLVILSITKTNEKDRSRVAHYT
jgi:hypothetical protein